MTAVDDATLDRTRRSLHSVAEHVLAAARHAATGRIGLRPVPGGFGTPPFPTDGTAMRELWVVGADLVVRDDGQTVGSSALSTVGAAAELAGVRPGAPRDVYTPVTALEPDRALEVDPAAANVIADWFDLSQRALDALVAEHAALDPAAVQLWPEHFDLATTIGEVNYGGSPGDDDHRAPYLYVGPWSVPAGPFWNESFGASLGAADVGGDVDVAVEFLRTGHRLAAA